MAWFANARGNLIRLGGHGTGVAKKEKPHRIGPLDLQSSTSMRLAQVGLGSGVGRLVLRLQFISGEVRVLN